MREAGEDRGRTHEVSSAHLGRLPFRACSLLAEETYLESPGDTLLSLLIRALVHAESDLRDLATVVELRRIIEVSSRISARVVSKRLTLTVDLKERGAVDMVLMRLRGLWWLRASRRVSMHVSSLGGKPKDEGVTCEVGSQAESNHVTSRTHRRYTYSSPHVFTQLLHLLLR